MRAYPVWIIQFFWVNFAIKKMKQFFRILLLMALVFSAQSCQKTEGKAKQIVSQVSDKEILTTETSEPNYDSIFQKLPDSAFVELAKWDKDFVLDVRYATTNNFTNTVLYPCARAFLRKKAAQDLLKAHQEFKKLGYRLKLFDCYRPHSVQFVMWDVTPNKNYVGNPHKGSMHNRGCAIDVTLVDKTNEELDMGTTYDFFGKAAHTYNQNLPAQVIKNRKVLRDILGKYGFGTIKTEWWHLSYRRTIYPVVNIPIPCDPKKIHF